MVRFRLIHDRTGEGKKEKEYLVQIEIYHYNKLIKKAQKNYIAELARLIEPGVRRDIKGGEIPPNEYSL